MINKEIMRVAGIDSSILLSILADAEAIHGSEFTQTVDQILHFSAGYLTKRKQADAIKKLESLEIVESKLKGVPPIRHFKINTEKLIDIIENRGCGN